jgi:hypothetical protein
MKIKGPMILRRASTIRQIKRIILALIQILRRQNIEDGCQYHLKVICCPRMSMVAPLLGTKQEVLLVEQGRPCYLIYSCTL